MRKYLFIAIVLLQLISFGCKKEEVDLKPILTSKSWEEIDSLYNGKLNNFKTLYRVTFNPNGKVEIIYRNWGIRPSDPIGFVRLDTLFRDYTLLNSESRITFKPIKLKNLQSDTTNIFYECDSIQYFTADWHIQKINSDFLEIHGLNPDTTNHANCFMVEFLGDFNLRPYEK